MAAKKTGGKQRAPKATKGKTGNVIPFKGDAPKGEDKPKDENNGNIGHNFNAAAEARKAALIAAHKETYDLEKQEEALMKQYITPLREKRSEIKASLKKDYEITAPQFNAWHGVYYFDREAESGSDWVTMQIIREQAAALPVGGTMDLVDLADKVSAQLEEKAKAEAAKKKTVENVEHTL